jgi:hypothetical protein
MTLWRVNCLLLSLLWVLCRLLYRCIYYLFCGLSTKLSIFKVKATLANTYTTAPATSPCCICNCLSHLYLCKCSLSLLGSYLHSLAVSYFCPPRRTLILVTRCTTSILAANHTDKLLYIRKT